MKKLLAALLCVLLLVPACAAPAEEAGISAASILVRTDPAVFSPVTGHDLAAVREYVIAELKSRPEWKETKIPAGEWAVGTDLPAGTYAFRHTDTRYSTTIRFTHMAGHSKKEASFLILAGEEVGKAELPDSTVLRLDNPVILAPPSFAAVSVRAAEKDTAYSIFISSCIVIHLDRAGSTESA